MKVEHAGVTAIPYNDNLWYQKEDKVYYFLDDPKNLFVIRKPGSTAEPTIVYLAGCNGWDEMSLLQLRPFAEFKGTITVD